MGTFREGESDLVHGLIVAGSAVAWNGRAVKRDYRLGILRTGEGNNKLAAWLFYSPHAGTSSHSHFNALNFGLFSHGLSMICEQGYPLFTGGWPSRSFGRPSRSRWRGPPGSQQSSGARDPSPERRSWLEKRPQTRSCKAKASSTPLPPDSTRAASPRWTDERVCRSTRGPAVVSARESLAAKQRAEGSALQEIIPSQGVTPSILRAIFAIWFEGSIWSALR